MSAAIVALSRLDGSAGPTTGTGRRPTTCKEALVRQRGDTFRMNPVSLFAPIGAVVAFVVTGAIVDVIWVAVGAAAGGLVGFAVRVYGRRARRYAEAIDLRESASKADLLEEARRLDIPGRNEMNKDQLVDAITARRNGD
jgi:hypothetical protein